MCDSVRTDELRIRMEILHPTFLKQLLFLQNQLSKEHLEESDYQLTSPQVSLRQEKISTDILEENGEQSKIFKSKNSYIESEDQKSELVEKNKKKLKYIFEEMVHFERRFLETLRLLKQTSKYEEQRIQDVCGMYFGVHCSLTRFRLLFTKLKEALSPGDKNMENVQKALKVLNDLLQISEGEVLRQDKISDAQIAFAKIDGREMNFRHIPPLLREGPCKKIPRRSSHKRNLDRHLFLFAGYLVITEVANPIGRYQVKSELLLSGMNFTESELLFPVKSAFRIRSMHLERSEKEKTEWWDDIQSAISEERGRKDSIIPISSTDKIEGTTATSAAEWVKDEQSTMCAECYAQFTVLNRRHHCRACGKVFCGSCSAYRAPIAYLGGKVKRVCVIDYYLIHGDLKPPTAAIMEGILRRTQKESASVEAGYMHWCVYVQGTWKSRSLIRNHKSSNHKNLVLNLDQLNALSSTSSMFFPEDEDANNSNGLAYTSDIGNNCADCASKRDNRDGNEDGSLGISNQAISRSAVSIQRSIPKGTNNSNEALSTPKRTVPPGSMPIYLGRIYCVLQADTLLAMYAARADSRPKDQLPLLGTRLFYLDRVPDNLNTISVQLRTRSSSRVTSDPPMTGDPASSDSRLAKSPSQTSLVSGTTSRVTSGSSRSSSSTVNTSDSSEEQQHLVRPSEIRAGNPLYRNHKPPTKPIKPKHLSEVLRALHDIADGHVTRMAGQFESNEQISNPAISLRNKNDTNSVSKSSSSMSSSSSTSFSSSSKPCSGFSREEVIQQLDSISPIVLGILKNNLGFLLLPMNTDCLAHYFEAPTYEMRTRWINAIRQTCVDYLNK
ncbi:FYVE RhoGEF and PH domain-containing protein 2 [Fasciola hepatica]|uniref:FYVE RhoGEF and PH domain-containing protein 2 n=1 Tax=Fasciola hepatica TaxID=6192 RepID=A0A4E0RT32_FASHE|nr:FYVE RhoGEF and PH domain-containing protein 2 [Fasciola hepatica]